MDAIEPGPVRVFAIRILIGKRRRIAARVPFLAARSARLAADTRVEIDD
jgi:hypothetical protein